MERDLSRECSEHNVRYLSAENRITWGTKVVGQAADSLWAAGREPHVLEQQPG